MQFPFDLRDTADFDVVGFGTNAVDYLITVPEFPKHNSKIELSSYARAPGGEIATTMVGLRRLGLKSAYVGRFGSDAEGEFGLKSLVEEGVDVEFAERVPDARTQIAFIIIDQRDGERTVIWQRDQRLAYRSSEVPISIVARTKLLHCTPHDVEACVALAREARDQGVPVSLDIDRVFPGVEELLPLVDILIASADFTSDLLGEGDRKRSLERVAEKFGCSVTGLTLGEAGSLLLCEGKFIETPGFSVPGGCMDTTGAGDSFRVGLLYGLLKGMSIEESAIRANAVAALKCRAVGARTALPTIAELDALVTGR